MKTEIGEVKGTSLIVLQGIAEGCSLASISRMAKVSRNCVQQHVYRLTRLGYIQPRESRCPYDVTSKGAQYVEEVNINGEDYNEFQP